MTPPKETFNGLSTKEWVLHSRNVINMRFPPRDKKRILHGATFPEDLAIRLIRMYTNVNDIVFDPFVGTGTTLSACLKTQRRGIGIELNPTFADVAKKSEMQRSLDQFIGEKKEKKRIKVVNTDCRNLDTHVKERSVQLILTSPPYANFIRKSVKDRTTTHKNSIISTKNKSTVKAYSDDKNDFGNLEYNDFLTELKPVMKKCFDVTKDGGYGVWIVKDSRDVKNNIPYVPFHSDIARLGESVGFKYHDLIVWDQNDQRRMVLLGYPSVFYTNQNCSFFVVFRKSR